MMRKYKKIGETFRDYNNSSSFWNVWYSPDHNALADYESSSGTVRSLMHLLIHLLAFRLFILQPHMLIFIGTVLA